jgi:F-type H+-transporting ATPase subunit b
MEALGLDIKLLIAQIVNFVLFLLIFNKFIAKPFMKYLHDEKRKELEKEKLMAELQVQEEAMIKEKDAVLTKANREAAATLASAKQMAEKQKEEIILQAQKESADIKSKTQAQLKAEKDTLYSGVKDYIIKGSSDMTKKVLQEFLNPEDQKKILERVEKKMLKG